MHDAQAPLPLLSLCTVLAIVYWHVYLLSTTVPALSIGDNIFKNYLHSSRFTLQTQTPLTPDIRSNSLFYAHTLRPFETRIRSLSLSWLPHRINPATALHPSRPSTDIPPLSPPGSSQPLIHRSVLVARARPHSHNHATRTHNTTTHTKLVTDSPKNSVCPIRLTEPPAPSLYNSTARFSTSAEHHPMTSCPVLLAAPRIARTRACSLRPRRRSPRLCASSRLDNNFNFIRCDKPL